MNVRFYGRKPYTVAVIHGGPGAPGSVAAVARELSSDHGVLEPLQTATSLEGQVIELYEALREHASPSVTLIGHSWGAWLAFLVAARFPALVRKLILVGSGPFEESYVRQLSANRLSHLTEHEQAEFRQLLSNLNTSADDADKDRLMSRLEAFVHKTDNYDPLEIESDAVDRMKADGNIFQSVWPEAAQLRRSGQLLAYARAVACPVAAIHGDYDPHPAEGVRETLGRVLDSFSFELLERCGHSPWQERHARDRFFQLLRKELA